MPTTIHPFPELRAYAESEARDAYSSMREVGIMYPYDEHGRHRADVDPWDQIPSGTRDWWVTARLTLLCDLTRPASRDAVARLVVAKLGGPEEGADAGGWWEFERWDGGCLVRLYSGRNCHELWASESVAVRENGVEADAIVPDMAGCQTLASALSAIVAHLWPSE